MPILLGAFLKGRRAKVLKMCGFAATMVNNVLTKGACCDEQSIMNPVGVLPCFTRQSCRTGIARVFPDF